MRLWGLLGAVLLATALYSSGEAFDGSLSDDELAEALDRGDLSVADFVRLRELQQLGDDSLARSLYHTARNSSSLETIELSDPDTSRGEADAGSVHTLVRQSYTRRNRDYENSRYDLTARSAWGNWQADFQIRREYTVRERFRRRAIAYRPTDHIVERITAGSFIAQFGLGSVLGYSGRRLQSHQRLDGESFVSPDHGGFNGLHTVWSGDELSGQALVSYQRDNSHALTVVGAEVVTGSGQLTIGLAFSEARLRHRATDRTVRYQRIGSTITADGSHDHVALEVSAEPDRAGSEAVLAEFNRAGGFWRLRAHLWSYGEQYRGLVSGSRGLTLISRDSLEHVDFRYTSRHRDQSGGMIDLRTDFAPAWRLHLRSELGTANNDRYETRLLGGIERLAGRAASYQLSIYLRERVQGADRAIRRDIRLERRRRFASGWWLVSLMRRTESGRPDHYALFTRGRVDLPHNRTVEYWLHLSNLTFDAAQLNRSYLYLRFIQKLYRSVTGDIKLSHSFVRSATIRHTFQLQLGIEVSV